MTQVRAKGHGAVGWSHTALDFTPADLPNLVAWYRADNVTASGGDVTGWPDNNGDSNLDLGTPSSNPTLLSSVAAINNQPAVRFANGALDHMSNSHTSFSLADGMRLYLVMQETNQDVQDSIFDAGDTVNAMRCRQVSGSGTVLGLVITSNGQGSTIVALNTWFTLGTYFNGASSRIDFNNVPDTTDPVNPGSISGSPKGLTVGATSGGGSQSGIDVAEIIVSSADLSADDKTKLFSYISTRYGL